MQGFLSRTDEHITELQEEVRRKDEEIVFLRSMLASLSEKVDQLEKTAIGRMGEPVAPPSHLLSPPFTLSLPSPTAPLCSSSYCRGDGAEADQDAAGGCGGSAWSQFHPGEPSTTMCVVFGVLYCHSLVLPYSHSPILPYPPPQNEVQNVQMQLGVAGSESMACALYSMYKYNMAYSMYKYNMVYSMYNKYNMVYSMYKYNMVYSMYKYNMVYSMYNKYNMVYSMYTKYNMAYSMYTKYNMAYSMYTKYNMVYSMYTKCNMVYSATHNMYSTKCSKHVMCFCTCNWSP